MHISTIVSVFFVGVSVSGRKSSLTIKGDVIVPICSPLKEKKMVIVYAKYHVVILKVKFRHYS